MKKKTKNFLIPLIACVLALILVLGTSAALFTDNPISDAIGDVVSGGSQTDDDNPSVDPSACSHKRMQATSFFGNTTSCVKMTCVDCGEYDELLYIDNTSFLSDFSASVDEKGKVTYSGRWSVGSWHTNVEENEPYNYVPFDSVSENGDWLCHDGKEWMNKNCFRYKYSASSDPFGFYSIGLGLRADANGEVPPYDVAISYHVPSNGFYTISSGFFKVGDYGEVYDFNVFVNGQPLLKDWIRIGNSNCRDDIDVCFSDPYALHALVAARAAESGFDISALDLRAGSTLSFAARHIEGTGTVDQACFYPQVNWVSSSGFFVECVSECHLYNEGTCRICGHAQ